jgi:hypothetical protein
VQAKLVEERTRRARELNLKVRGLPLPHPSPDPMEVGTLFLRDTLDIFDVTLDRAWLGYDSTLFLRFRTTTDRLRVLRARRKLFSLPSRIFLDEDLTRAQFVELKHSREQVMAARQAGKWAVIRNLKAVIRDSFPPRWEPELGLPNDGHGWGDDRVQTSLSVVGMAMDLFGHRRVSYMMLSSQQTSSS